MITGFKTISHPRTRKQLKEKEIARGNSAAVQANFAINPEDFLDVLLLFNLKMTDEIEIEVWFVHNLAVNNDEYNIQHKQGTNVFRIRKEPDSESNNSEMVLTNLTINPEDFLFTVRKPSANSDAVKANYLINLEEFLNVPLLFDINKTSENEIEDWMVKSIRYWITKNAPTDNSTYYIDYLNDSNLFIIRRD